MLFSCQVVSNSLQLHGLQHVRPPCPSPFPRVCPSSCPLSRWYHPTISPSVTLFCLHSFQASGSFPVCWLFTTGSQSIGTLASASVLPMNIQGWFPSVLPGLISFLTKGLSRVFSSNTIESTNSLVLSLLYGPNLTFIHDYWKSHSFDYTDLCQ